MSPTTAPGRAVRQSNRILLQTPTGEGYVYLDDLLDLIGGDLDPDVEVLDGWGGLVGKAALSYNGQVLFPAVRGTRYQIWISQVTALIRGRLTEAPIRLLNCPGDPTRPVYYRAPRQGARA